MMTARNKGECPVSESAVAMHWACVRRDVWMLALAKPHIGLGWDLFSLISCSETHQMAARYTGLPISVCVLTLCNMHVQIAAHALL